MEDGLSGIAGENDLSFAEGGCGCGGGGGGEGGKKGDGGLGAKIGAGIGGRVEGE